MLTRRSVLTGTAAASIAAIATAHGRPAAAALDLGIGTLEDAALAAFNKGPNSFGVFVKFHKAAAELFFKVQTPGVVEVFQKVFSKSWSPTTTFALQFLTTLDDAELAFEKFSKHSATFLIKGESANGVEGTIELGVEGVQVEVKEVEFGD